MAQSSTDVSTAGWRLVLLRLGVGMLALLFAGSAFAPLVAPFDAISPVCTSFGEPLPPAPPYWLGTDELGRDVLSRILYGGRITLVVAGAATFLALGVGVAIGVAAGYWRAADALLMRLADVFLAFPSVLLAIAVAALFEPGIGTLLAVIALVSWPPVARAIRGEVLSLRQREYVGAAAALGADDARIVRRHLLPALVPTVLALGAVSACGSILLEAGLSYLGLGVPVPEPSWGRMIADSLTYFRVAPWLVVFPGLAIGYAVLAFNLIGLGLLKDGQT